MPWPGIWLYRHRRQRFGEIEPSSFAPRFSFIAPRDQGFGHGHNGPGSREGPWLASGAEAYATAAWRSPMRNAVGAGWVRAR